MTCFNQLIRPYRPTDESAVVAIWYRSGRAAYTFLPAWQTFSLPQAQHVFQPDIATRCALWVALDEERVVAFMALKQHYIDRLYVDPCDQRQGWGSSLIDHAKSLHPQGLELHTHQANYSARAFYEKHGFIAVGFGTSPPPESAPDVLYRWGQKSSAQIIDPLG